jgi:hypothetical protein
MNLDEKGSNYQNIHIMPRTIQSSPTIPFHPVPTDVAKEARTHIFIHVVFPAKNAVPGSTKMQYKR